MLATALPAQRTQGRRQPQRRLQLIATQALESKRVAAPFSLASDSQLILAPVWV